MLEAKLAAFLVRMACLRCKMIMMGTECVFEDVVCIPAELSNF